MKLFIKFVFVLVALLLASSFVLADEGAANESYSIWFGGHYSDFTDYTKKVGEYDKGENEALPEFALKYLSAGSNSILRLVGHYYDDKNAYAKFNSTISDKLKLSVKYRSLLKQEGQDLLVNMEAKEYLPSFPKAGGKMLTHEIQDPDADYNTHRQELLSQFSLLLSEKNNLRFNATHRMILKSGTEQKISSNHCFSCHLTSQTAKVKNTQHQFEAGIDGEIGKFDLGYTFGYRLFESDILPSMTYYDNARHPIHGGAAGEFGPRLIYEDEYLEFSKYAKTEKISHKVKFRSNAGNGYLAGSIGYSQAENKGTNLKSDALSSSVNYTTMLNEKTKLIAKGSMSKIEADTVYIDLPTYREFAADSNYYDFDFTRYSLSNRTNIKLSAEVIKRMNPKMTFALKGGYDITDRETYQIFDEGISTKELYLQGKMRYRKGLKYSTSLKLRFEKISDPYLSSKDIFESAGHGVLYPLVPDDAGPTDPGWVFYFQREALRYQNITTKPTQVLDFNWNMNYNPTSDLSIVMGLRGKLDKNDDLDSLDVKHSSFVPSVMFNYIPDMKTSINLGYTYNYDKSRLPIAVALFDG